MFVIKVSTKRKYFHSIFIKENNLLDRPEFTSLNESLNAFDMPHEPLLPTHRFFIQSETEKSVLLANVCNVLVSI